MAWKIFSIVLITLTTTSAYKFPVPAYYQQYQSRNFGASQYRRVDAGSLEQDFVYQGRSAAYNQPNPRQLTEADYSQYYPTRPVERSIPSDYSQQRDQDHVRVTPTSEDTQLRNGNTSSYKILNNYSKTYPSLSNRRGVDTESAVVFPGPTSGTREKQDILTKPCGELNICENSPDYPHEQVKALLAKVTDANIRFNLDVDIPEIAQRGSNGLPQPQSNQTLELCKLDARIIYPDKVKTKFGKWVWIVNGDKTKVQGFRGVQCHRDQAGKPCDDLVSFPCGYRAYCEQKKMDRYMWALDETKTKMELVTVSWPTCCTCVLEPTNCEHL